MPSVLPYWRLSSFYFFYFGVVGALTPFWPSYLDHLGYSAKEIGVMTAVIMGTRLIAPNFWSYLADATQERLKILRVGCSLACVLFIGVFIAPDYWWLLAVVCSYTFFWHAVLPQFEVITLSYLDKQENRYGQIRLWGSVGFILAVIGLGWLFDRVSIAHLPIAILAFLTLILLSSFGFDEPNAVKKNRNSGAFKQIMAQPFIWCFLLASFLLQLSHGPYYTFYTLFLVEQLGYTRGFAGLMWSMGVVAEIVMFLFMPRLMARYGIRELFLFLLVITSARWLSIGLFGENLVILLAAQFLHAFSFAVAHSVSIEVVRTHFVEGSQSQGQALYSSLSFGAGGALGALGSGVLWHAYQEFTFVFASFATSIAFLAVYFGMKKDKMV